VSQREELKVRDFEIKALRLISELKMRLEIITYELYSLHGTVRVTK
jgi:hypothetical protein